MTETSVRIGEELSPELSALAQTCPELREAIGLRIAAGASLACRAFCASYPGRVTSVKVGDEVSCEPDQVVSEGRGGLPYIDGKCALVTPYRIIEGPSGTR